MCSSRKYPPPTEGIGISRVCMCVWEEGGGGGVDTVEQFPSVDSVDIYFFFAVVCFFVFCISGFWWFIVWILSFDFFFSTYDNNNHLNTAQM